MKNLLLPAISLALAFGTVTAQDAPATPPVGQASTTAPGSNSSQLGWRAGITGRTADSGLGGRGVTGTVTSVSADHYTLKT